MNGAVSQSGSYGAQPASTPVQDPIAAARAVAARLAGQMGQAGQPGPGPSSAAPATHGQGGYSAQDPIAAAQATAARLAARHGDISTNGPPSNPYGGSSRGTKQSCLPQTLSMLPKVSQLHTQCM